MTFQKEGELLLHTITPWASENREGVVRLFWKSHGLCTRKKEVLWVGGRERVVLAKAVKIVTFGIHYSQKEKSLHWSKAWKREIWWVQSDQWVHRLLPPWWMKAVAEKSQGSFPALNSPVITFIHSVENSKYWEFLNNYWKTLRVTKYRKRLWRTWHFTQGPHGHHTYVVPPESTSPSCWSRDVAQAEIHRMELAAREGRYWWRTPTEGHGWEHEQFCIKIPFKSLDDPGIVVSKGSRGNILEGWISWSEISAVALSSKDRILDSSPPSIPLKY